MATTVATGTFRVTRRLRALQAQESADIPPLLDTLEAGMGQLLVSESDRPFAILSSLADTYSAFMLIREMEQDAGARVVAGHDPAVMSRFPERAGSPGIVRVAAG